MPRHTSPPAPPKDRARLPDQVVSPWVPYPEAAHMLGVAQGVLDSYVRHGAVMRYKIGPLQSVRCDVRELAQMVEPGREVKVTAPDWLPITMAAEYLRVSDSTMARYLSQGLVTVEPGRGPGGTPAVSRIKLDELMRAVSPFES